MKSRILLSIVLSLIMVFGVSAGSAYAEENDMDDAVENVSYDDDRYDDDHDDGYDLDDRLEFFCEMTDEEKREFFVDHPRLEQFSDRLANICELSIDEREDAIDRFIKEHVPEARDHDDMLEDKLERYCEMTDEEKKELIAEHDKSEEKVAEMERYCLLDETERDAYIDEHEADYRMYDKDIRHMMDRYCEMSFEDKRAFVEEHDKTTDHVKEMNKYCTLGEDDRMKFIKEHKDQYKDHMKDAMYTDKEMRDTLERYCEMSDEDKTAYIAEHEKTADKAEKMDRYCTLDEDGKSDFIEEHLDEYRAYMMDKYSDKKHLMDYDRYCSMAASDRAAEITDVAKLDKISEWCDMTPEERKEYKKDHDSMKDRTDMPFDRMSDVAKDQMSDVPKDKLHDKTVKFSDMSPRLKAMIKSEHDISDERHDEIRMKYEERHGDLDKKKTELKIKFDKHMVKMEFKMTDEHKSAIHDRVAEMKAFKAELRVNSADMTDVQKQELREEFIEKAKDLQLAWISPRTQMTAGIDAADIECREGFSLVLKESNGAAMCLKADTALKMIERGIAVPAN